MHALTSHRGGEFLESGLRDLRGRCVDKEAHVGENETIFPTWTSRCSKSHGWSITAFPASTLRSHYALFFPKISIPESQESPQ